MDTVYAGAEHEGVLNDGVLFISYARNDGAVNAERIDRTLAGGFTTRRDTRGIDPSADFTAEIEKAIDEALRALAFRERQQSEPGKVTSTISGLRAMRHD